MTAYCKIENGTVVAWPYTVQDLKRDTPASLPKIPSAELLTSHGVFPVEPLPKPAVSDIDIAQKNATPHQEGEQWVLGWTVNQKPQDQLADDVNAERDRRLSAGVTVSVTGYGDIPVQGGPGDQINMIALGDTAKDLIGAGVTAAVVPFRDADNTMHDLTPEQVAEMVRKAKEAASAIYAVSWAMKDGTGDFSSGIPADYTADTHWP